MQLDRWFCAIPYRTGDSQLVLHFVIPDYTKVNSRSRRIEPQRALFSASAEFDFWKGLLLAGLNQMPEHAFDFIDDRRSFAHQVGVIDLKPPQRIA